MMVYLRQACLCVLLLLVAPVPAGAADKADGPNVATLTKKVEFVERSLRLSKFRYVIKQSRKVEAFAKKVARVLKKNVPKPGSNATKTPTDEVETLTQRVKRARAISVIRAGGEWTLRGERVRNGVQREQNLRYAYWILKTHPVKSPRYDVWFAEALARLPIKKPEALKRLRVLNTKRLIRNGWRTPTRFG